METDHRQAAQRHHATLCQGDALAAWCVRWLGVQPTSVLFEVAHLSIVTGLRLTDGREVVVKARSPAVRLQACVRVQRHLWAAGFPCPEPLAGPHPLGTLTATAEALVPGGTQLAPGADSPQLFAAALAELVRLAPPVTALPTSVDEWQVCWAAGLWIRAYNAKKATLEGDGGELLERLASEVPERLRLARA